MNWCALHQHNVLLCLLLYILVGLVCVTYGTLGPAEVTHIQHQQQRQSPSIQAHHQQQQQQSHYHHPPQQSPQYSQPRVGSGHHAPESRTSYAMLSQAMSQAVNHEFSKFLFFFI